MSKKRERSKIYEGCAVGDLCEGICRESRNYLECSCYYKFVWKKLKNSNSKIRKYHSRVEVK
jgi:hypothetical protein